MIVNNSSFLPVHPFPARMAPDLALEYLSDHRRLRVLDPMVGSGTVVRLAQDAGHVATGFDTDPLALLIAESLCTPICSEALRRAAEEVLRGASDWRELAASDAVPESTDEETHDFVRYWFDLRARRQLRSIVREINKTVSRALRIHLLTALSRCIVVKDNGISLARDVAHSRPHRSYRIAPRQPIDAFMASIEKSVRILDRTNNAQIQKAHIRQGDARHLPVKARSFDLVITSPPYLNAIDYLRGHKLALVWFGFTISRLRELRGTNIGSERSAASPDAQDPQILSSICRRELLTNKQRGMVARYVQDVRAVISEIHRVLTPGGTCVIVVADSQLQSTPIRTSRAVASIGEETGFILQREYRREIPASRRYLPPPTSGSAGDSLSKRMRTEVVTVFQK